MTISPELFKQFNRLVDLAVVTNIMPYLLSMAAVAVIMKVAKVEPSKAKLYNVIAIIGAIYSFYALFSTGITEVFGPFYLRSHRFRSLNISLEKRFCRQF